MAGLINIGLTGLLGHQSALSTTGNNVANANTPGYSRQQAIFETLPTQFSGSGYVGTGVSLANVQRLNNEFVNQQLRSDTTLNGGATVMAAELGRLDNLFGSESTGLNGAMTDFFKAVQDTAESPDSIPQRQLLISRGEALAQRFHSVAARLDEQAASIEQQISNQVTTINSLAKSIAELNLAISSSPGQARGIQPNELLDQRDEKLRQLSDIVQVQVAPQGDGQVDVYFGNGQSLVSRDLANAISLEPHPENASQKEVLLHTGSSTRTITGSLAGGRLGALLEFRASALEPAQNALGQIALGVSSAINEQHAKGLDLEGKQGGLFFKDINSLAAMASRVTANTNNDPATGQVSVEIRDASKVGADEFVLEFGTVGAYTITRVSDGVVVADDTGGPLADAMDAYGFRVNVSAPFSEGDRFRLNPSANAARDIAMAIARPREVALASPLKAMTSNSNTGTGAIDQGTVVDIDGAGFSDGRVEPSVKVEFISANEYQVSEGGTLLLDGAGNPQVFDLGPTNQLFDPAAGAPDYGFQFGISGTPSPGDSFTISSNDNNASDNRNALALGAIADKGLIDVEGTKVSPNKAYGLLVTEVGTETSRAQRTQEASSTLLKQSSNSWQEQSGVNLDEEAGKLIQYQAAYNASAQVVSVARELFNTLLGTFR